MFDERKPSKTSTDHRANSELTNMIHKKIKKKIYDSINDMNHVRNTGTKGTKDFKFTPELVLFRKLQHPEIIFNDTIQNLEFG